ncbi:DNA polymerase kappa-like isoform X1 [Oncorhynchus nerka]|uniref:DNA polymerase kappa-like isoform X1 n=1 Tax=Oncorhynchus nerka TaxID=8023 RepID=UPI0011317FF4|nr:DNA polymerase kappa-like isoform X1 [Oncorhynchus nerka]
METGGTSSSGEGFLSRMALNDNKAGMEGLDRDKINKIIMKSSKGSRFYENEMKKEQQVNQRIERMMLQKAHITEQQLSKAQTQVEKMTFDLERVRDLSRVIVHVDMDAFYAAVETRDCPDLKDKPMAVGSMSMLTTSNYHARKFGVRAAMPGFIAKKLCPNLVIVPTDFDKYRAVSAEVQEIFADYDPHFLPMSLDEAYLDISEHLEQRRVWPEALRTHRLRTNDTGTATSVSVPVEEQGDGLQETVEGLSPVLFEDSPSSSCPFLQDAPGGDVMVFGTCAEEAVREMRFRIEQKTSLTASAGIAPNMMLAKVCSDKNKPNGQYRLPSNRQAVMVFIQDLPVRKVSGIGNVTEKMLGALGITSCIHLGQEMALLALLFSETSWHHFLDISLGLGSTHIERFWPGRQRGDGERKSMSTERTFGEMVAFEEQFSLCRQLCQDVAQDLQKEALKGKTVTLKLKNVNFEVKTRAWTLPCAVATSDELFAVAKDLLKTEIDNVSPQPLRLRLMGIRVSSFVSADEKKPQQKSIVGFLQKGRADSSSPSQISSHKPVKEHQPKPPGQTQPLPCPSLVQQSQGQEDHPWVPSWGGVEVGKTGEQQQSFFQKARAQRLRLQAEREDPPEDGKWNVLETRLGPASSATKPKQTPTPIQKNPNTSAETQFSMSALTASDNMTHAPTASSTEAHVSTSLCWSTEPGTDSLTCPVCFREVNTTDLTVFNRHVDQCLSGVPMEHNIHTDRELEKGSSVCEEEVEKEREGDIEKEIAEGERRREEGLMVIGRDPLSRCMLDSSAGDNKGLLLYETSTTNISLNAVGLNPVFLNTCPNGGVSIPRVTDPNILKGSSQSDPRVRPLSPGGPRPMTTPKVESHDPREPALTCPVCQVTQDTDNLTLFNRHVDLCLNQEVLHELEGLASVDCTPHNATPAAHKEREQPLRRAPQKGKSKRRGSSPPPPSKKVKALGPARNTIDKFFR